MSTERRSGCDVNADLLAGKWTGRNTPRSYGLLLKVWSVHHQQHGDPWEAFRNAEAPSSWLCQQLWGSSYG